MRQATSDAWHVNADEPPSKGVHKFELLAAAACDSELTRADVAVLAVILGHANSRSGVAWPGINRIAEQANLHRVTVVHGIAKLESRGWVKVDRAERGKSNRYRPIFRGSSATATRGSSASATRTP